MMELYYENVQVGEPGNAGASLDAEKQAAMLSTLYCRNLCSNNDIIAFIELGASKKAFSAINLLFMRISRYFSDANNHAVAHRKERGRLYRLLLRENVAVKRDFICENEIDILVHYCKEATRMFELPNVQDSSGVPVHYDVKNVSIKSHCSNDEVDDYFMKLSALIKCPGGRKDVFNSLGIVTAVDFIIFAIGLFKDARQVEVLG